MDNALVSTLIGPKDGDTRAENRRMAFDGLKPAYLRSEPRAVEALQYATQYDASRALRKDIATFVEQNPRDVGPQEENPDPTA